VQLATHPVPNDGEDLTPFVCRILLVALSALVCGCSPRLLLVNSVADQLASQGQADEDDLLLARDAAPFYLKLSESMLRETPAHLPLTEAVAAGFTQYAYAFVAFEAEKLQASDAQAAQALNERAARLYARAQRHAMTALSARHHNLLSALAEGHKAVLRLSPDEVGLAYWGAAAWAARIALSKDQPEVVADLPSAVRLATLAWQVEPTHGRGALASLMGTAVAHRHLVPKNSLYHRQLLKLGEAWRAAQGQRCAGRGLHRRQPGRRSRMARRMRIGQLQGALLSVVGLREIEPSIAALQSLPLLFRSWDEVDHVREKMRPAMEKAALLDKGFVVLGWGDAGWVRFFSKGRACARRLQGHEVLRLGLRARAAGHHEEPGLHAGAAGDQRHPAGHPDRHDQRVPSTPYFALASQVYGTAGHMLEINWAPIVGALVVTRKAWDAMSPAGQQALREAGDKAGMQMRAQARQEVDEAVAAMVKRGLSCTAHARADARVDELAESSTRASAAAWCRPRPSTRSWHLKAYRAGGRAKVSLAPCPRVSRPRSAGALPRALGRMAGRPRWR
jgi:TRAP-type C4-dicarboxylate transport system substrate-binding protein